MNPFQIYAREGFVQQIELRIQSQTAGQSQPSLHSAGKLPREAMGILFQIHKRQEKVGFFMAMGRQHIGEVLPHYEARGRIFKEIVNTLK